MMDYCYFNVCQFEQKTLTKGKNLPFDDVDVDVDDVTKTKQNKIIDKFFFYFFFNQKQNTYFRAEIINSSRSSSLLSL